jgi:3-oxoacyl-[acyl-carrier protein] reductase
VKHNAKCGLTSVSKALSADVAHANVTLNNLLPERINTSRQQYMAQRLATQQNISVDKAYRQIAAGQPGLPEEFADACAFLCSAQAGFISGQNLQLDGGSYSGLV